MTSNLDPICFNHKTCLWTSMVNSIDPNGKRFSSIPRLLYSGPINTYSNTLTNKILKIIGVNGAINEIRIESPDSFEIIPVEKFKATTDLVRRTIAHAIEGKDDNISNYENFSWQFFDLIRNCLEPYGVQIGFEGVSVTPNGECANFKAGEIRKLFPMVLKHKINELSITPPNWVKGNEDLFESFKNQKWTDLTVTCANGSTINCHKLIVATRCPVFQKMFSHNMQESSNGTIDLSEFEYTTVKAFLAFLYIGENPFKGNQKDVDVVELMHLANRFHMPILIDNCAIHLEENFEDISVGDRQTIEDLGQLLGHKHLLDICKQYSEYVPICIDFNTESANVFGICVEPKWEPIDFQKTDEGWKGAIPIGKKFKFVQFSAKDPIASNETKPVITWETGDNRTLRDIKERHSVITSRNIKF